jgi:zinc transport system ATP-binding protein
VLLDITLSVPAGGTLAIIGPNGAGKTTLAKILLGELRGYRGEAMVLGRPPGELPRTGLVGYVPQHRTALGHFPLTARHAVMLGLIRRRGLFRPFRAADRRAADEALEAVEIRPLARRPMEQLSGGQVQRVCIARALVSQPKMLILDEPTVGIDEAGQQRFIALVGRLREQFGLTVVMVSHDIRAVASLADTVACLNVTLHYHAHPEALSPQVLYEVFHCDFEAMHDHLHQRGVCDHDLPRIPPGK